LPKWQRLPDTGQVSLQRLGRRSGGRNLVQVLVLFDHSAVEGQPAIGACARGPDHDIAAMGCSGAFGGAGQGNNGYAGAGTQLDLAFFNTAQGPLAVDDK